MAHPTYSISTYDPNDNDDEFSWNKRHSGLSLWKSREPLRELKKRYSPDVAILIEREDVL